MEFSRMILLEQLADEIIAAHAEHLQNFLLAEPPSRPEIHCLVDAALANHYFNCRLWREEDLARRTHVLDSEIVSNKRAIDRYNQARNDAIEWFDEYLSAEISGFDECASLSSETPGAMMDRLSILALKQYHMAKQTLRFDVDPAQRIECQEKLQRLHAQHADLAACLRRLLNECREGKSRFKVYRQFKMYNDPRFLVASAN